MIAFDTNHLLRHLLADDPIQTAQVQALIQAAQTAGESIHLLDLVLLETCWVMQSALGLGRDGWSTILEALLEDPVFSFDHTPSLWKALERYRGGKADFGDYLIWGHCDVIGAKLETFDKKLKREL